MEEEANVVPNVSEVEPSEVRATAGRTPSGAEGCLRSRTAGGGCCPTQSAVETSAEVRCECECVKGRYRLVRG